MAHLSSLPPFDLQCMLKIVVGWRNADGFDVKKEKPPLFHIQ